MVVMTYPLIGNYGITDDDFECKNPSIGGLIVYDYNDMPSNFRYTKTLSELLEENGIPGISGVDTRKLTRSIRDLGSRRVLITSPDIPAEVAVEIIKNTPSPTMRSAASAAKALVFAHLEPAVQRRSHRLRHETQYRAQPQQVRLQRRCRAL